VKVIDNIPQAVMDHMILDLARSHAMAPPGLFKIIRGHAHIFHTPGDNDIGIAALDGLGRQHHCLERRAADLVDGHRFDLLR